MTRSATRVARGATTKPGPSTNAVLVRGRLAGEPTVRIGADRQRVASFDVGSLVHGRRSVVPVVCLAAKLPDLREGDEVAVFGHVRRRFFRAGSRTQSVTEIVAEHLVAGSRSARLDSLFASVTERMREARGTPLPKPGSTA